MRHKTSLLYKLFWIFLWLLVIHAWIYYQDYFDWRNKTNETILFIKTIDKHLIANKSLAMRQSRGIVDDTLTGNRDVSTGPCLQEELLPEWSLDLVHNPREEADDVNENQCSFFLSGKTKYLIEYDIYGNYIGIKSN